LLAWLMEKARRRATRAVVGEYHERELTALLEHVREGFVRLDAGELDELINRSKRSTRELRTFCNLRPDGAAWVIADARARRGVRLVGGRRAAAATMSKPERSRRCR